MNTYLLRVCYERKNYSWFTPMWDRYFNGDVLVYADSLDDAKKKVLEVLASKNPDFKYTSAVSKTIL